MKPFKEHLQEAISAIEGNYKTTWYEVSAHSTSNKDKNRTDRIMVSNKNYEKRIKDAIKSGEKLNGLKAGEYFVTFITGESRCGFVMLVDDNPYNTIRQRLNPKAYSYEKTALVRTNLPCSPKETGKPKSFNPKDIVIKLSEDYTISPEFESVPVDILEYFISTMTDISSLNEDTIVQTNEQNDVMFISENKQEIDEVRISRNHYILDLDAETIY